MENKLSGYYQFSSTICGFQLCKTETEIIRKSKEFFDLQEREQWKLCVFVSDNNRDAIEITSKCGSMSYCGAKGKQYPDKRPMGYPFTTNVSIDGNEVLINISKKLARVLFNKIILMNAVSNHTKRLAIPVSVYFC